MCVYVCVCVSVLIGKEISPPCTYKHTHTHTHTQDTLDYGECKKCEGKRLSWGGGARTFLPTDLLLGFFGQKTAVVKNFSMASHAGTWLHINMTAPENIQDSQGPFLTSTSRKLQRSGQRGVIQKEGGGGRANRFSKILPDFCSRCLIHLILHLKRPERSIRSKRWKLSGRKEGHFI